LKVIEEAKLNNIDVRVNPLELLNILISKGKNMEEMRQMRKMKK